MTALLCDSGPLIASFNRHDPDHDRSLLLLDRWPGRLLIPEPVLGETCNFLRNNVRSGPFLEATFLSAVVQSGSAIDVIDPTGDDRRRAAELVTKLASAPAGYVDSIIIAVAERLTVPHIATVDFKMIGMMSPVCRTQPLGWVLQEV